MGLCENIISIFYVMRALYMYLFGCNLCFKSSFEYFLRNILIFHKVNPFKNTDKKENFKFFFCHSRNFIDTYKLEVYAKFPLIN